MKFEGQYLSFDEYQALGGTLNDNNAFDLLEYEVRKKVNLRTQNRLINLTEIPFEVKICVNRLIDKVNVWTKNENKHNDNIASETVGSWSRSYITGTQIQETINAHSREIEDIMFEYLYGVVINKEHILYLG